MPESGGFQQNNKDSGSQSYTELSSFDLANPKNREICKNQLITILKYCEGSINWRVEGNLLNLLDKDLATIISAVNQYEFTNPQLHQEIAVSMFQGEEYGRTQFLNNLQKARRLLGSAAVSLSKGRSIEQALEYIQVHIPALIRDALQKLK